MIKESTAYSFPELTEEELNILLKILNDVDHNTEQLLNTHCLISTCDFIFDAETCKYKAFLKLKSKLKETAIRKKIMMEGRQ